MDNRREALRITQNGYSPSTIVRQPSVLHSSRLEVSRSLLWGQREAVSHAQRSSFSGLDWVFRTLQPGNHGPNNRGFSTNFDRDDMFEPCICLRGLVIKGHIVAYGSNTHDRSKARSGRILERNQEHARIWCPNTVRGLGCNLGRDNGHGLRIRCRAVASCYCILPLSVVCMCVFVRACPTSILNWKGTG